MPVGEVFEAPFAIEERYVCCGEGFDYRYEVVVVVHELQLNRPLMAGIACDGECGIRVIAGSFDQCLETEAFQSLCHSAAVPP